MTAHVYISVNHRNQVLRIPNAALRFKPSAENSEDNPKKQKSRGVTVYRLSGDKAEPLKLKTGVSDNTYTEILSGEIKSGDTLIIKELGNKKNKGSGSFKFRMF